MRRLWLVLALLLFAAAGCGLLPPQPPSDGKDDAVTSYRGGRYWQAPGGFGPDFWTKTP